MCRVYDERVLACGSNSRDERMGSVIQCVGVVFGVFGWIGV